MVFIEADLSIEPKDSNFKTLDNIKLSCRATLRTPHVKRKNSKNHLYQRHQKPTISWYKENDLIKPDQTALNETSPRKLEIQTTLDRVEHLLTSTLLISNANIEDSGKYRCIYENIQEQTVIKVTNQGKLMMFYFLLFQSYNFYVFKNMRIRNILYPDWKPAIRHHMFQ